jgi:starch synthase
LEVVLIASEAVPFAKTGGLADVVGALPVALARAGVGARVVIPCHRSVWSAGVPIEATGLTVRVPVGPRIVEGLVHRSHLPGSDVEVYLIDCPAYFDRPGIYQAQGVDYADNPARFVFFARAAIEAAARLNWRPDVFHVHDWPAALVPVYQEEVYRRKGLHPGAGSLLTVHNLAYQGDFWPGEMAQTGLDPRLFNWRQLEAYGRLNFLKAGLVYADLIGTVSPTYAREIQTPALGRGLDGLLRSRAADLRAVVNGIDAEVWDPAADPSLVVNYDIETFRLGKAACKADLQRRAGLDVRPDVPLLAQIGRLDPQKGWDLLASAADDLLRRDVQLVVLGQGHPRYHDLLERLVKAHPGKVRAFLEFADDLAHQIEAGADVFLMPSLYEPCGLSQLYSLRYGTVPVVRATGGLADTVVDATPAALAEGRATGFAFREATVEALRGAIGRALELWADRPAWDRLVSTGMRLDWSWDRGALAYRELYEETVRRRSARAVG